MDVIQASPAIPGCVRDIFLVGGLVLGSHLFAGQILGWAYHALAPGVPDDGLVPLSAVPWVMSKVALSYRDAVLLCLAVVGGLAYALPSFLGVVLGASTRRRAAFAWAAITIILVYSCVTLAGWCLLQEQDLGGRQMGIWEWRVAARVARLSSPLVASVVFGCCMGVLWRLMAARRPITDSLEELGV